MISPRLAVLIFGLLASSGIATARDPLRCPEGTRPQTKVFDKQDMRFEFCQDSRTALREGVAWMLDSNDRLLAEWRYRGGKRHGLQLLFDDKGQYVISETIYEDGKQISSRVTLAGLQDIAKKGTESVPRADRNWRVTAPDEHTFRIEVKLDTSQSEVQLPPDVLRKRLLSSAKVCAMFEIADTDIREIEAAYLNDKLEVLGEIVILRSECPAKPATR